MQSPYIEPFWHKKIEPRTLEFFNKPHQNFFF